ncbi:type I polyketide synthase [Streptomyces sp. NPDC096097]|uniref:type I polyketide synthase n=1 Tax=Streptomyces sp. NPDC096097 TaxID=3155546 RepID=UPI00331B7BAA
MDSSISEVVDALRASLLENERLRQQNQRLAAAPAEPIAIVGIGCRYPGGVRDAEGLWQLLVEGRDGMSDFPTDRDWERWDVPTARTGAFLHDAGHFDPGFFRISPREAMAMDPQQRLLLETSWEAIERAGIAPTTLKGSRTGVFIGGAPQEYGALVMNSAQSTGGYAITSVPGSVLSGRLSYVLGLEGPAVTVDTACSSSLVALHLAVQSLRSGECDLALAGGVMVMITPSIFAEFAAAGGSASDGRCKAFAAGADGTGWGEGAGVLAVQRLSDARRDGNPVLAVIRGSAVNQDGASNGLSAPNGPAQQRVIRQALSNAGVSAADVDMVEAHGTGTTLGDPIEAEALLATYGQGRPADRPLWLGTLKSNIGHTQAAAGVSGVIKAVLSLQHKAMPKTLHVNERTPQVDWSAGAVELLTEHREWDSERPRRAGVSSFGISGTNAHLILEEAPAEDAAEETAPAVAPGADTATPVLLSAVTAPALRAQAERLREHMATRPDVTVGELASALATTRTAFDHRAVVLAEKTDELVAALGELVRGESSPNVVQGTAGQVRSAVLFTGQGSQRPGMGQELYETFPVFARALDEVCAQLDPRLGRSLREVMWPQQAAEGAGLLDQTQFTQAGTFALGVALFRLLEDWGVRPRMLAGHSVGELTAAHVSGMLSLEDACALVAARGRLMQALPEGGAMVSIVATEEEVRPLLAEHPGRVGVAAVNGPSSVVISGALDAVTAITEHFTTQGRRTRRLPVSHAFHSPLMEPMVAELRQVAKTLSFGPAAIPVMSSVTGAPVGPGQWADPDYWARQVLEPVRFHDVVTALDAEGITVFLELGPDGALTSMVNESLPPTDDDRIVVAAPALRRERPEVRTLATMLAQAYTAGLPVDWSAFFAGRGVRRVDLPTYAFQRERYWIDDAVAPGAGGADPVDAAFWEAVEREDPDGLAALVEGGGAGEWEPVVSALSAWRRGRRDQSVLDGWRYRTVWRSVSVGSSGRLSGAWLVVSPGGEAPTEEVRAALAAAGAEAVVLEVAAGADREVLAARLAGTAEVSGVVSLLGWGDESAVASTVALVQAHGEVGSQAPLWVLTRGVAAVGSGDVVRPVQTQVWALGQVVGLERPGGWGGLIDVPAVWDERVASQFVRVLAGGEGEDQVAVRSSGVFGRRLVRAPFMGSSGVGEWRPRGTVLVTGGTGGVAGHVARWLAGSGAERVVLVSRSGEGAEGASGLVEELRGLGAEVSVVACDVTDRDAVAAVIDAIPAEQPLTAVIHAAGVSAYAELSDITPGHLDEAAGAKVLGARHLDELTAGLDLDAFVLFSSGAAVWGSGANGANAAANAFLDGLAWQRRARGQVATSVSWGNWKTAGTVEGDSTEMLSRRGIRGMEPQLAVQALRQAIEQDETALTVTDMDWERFVPGYTLARRRPLIEDIPEAVDALKKAEEQNSGFLDGSPGMVLRAALADLSETEQRAQLLMLVRTEAAHALAHSSAAEISATKPFKDLGFDSLTAMELRNRLTKATGLRLPATLVFDHPNPQQLAAHLHEQLVEGLLAAAPAAVNRSSHDEPLAIVGMACRFPGGVADPDGLWRLLLNEEEGLSAFPTDRGWENWGATGGSGRAGFLHEAGDFDAAFFGISPREAMAMDPQQRLLLETSWEVIERSGIDPHSLKGSSTGVFVGGGPQDYPVVLMGSPEAVSGYGMTGALGSVMSGRVAYALGLEGPAVTVDTACSSSLVALHLAVQALRNGECDLALAGGVTVLATPGAFAEFDNLGGMASDGRCKAFSSDADGTIWGEGIGMLAVERLSDARRNGHEVLALVSGSAVNQDGASNGLSAPNGPSQQRVIRQALANAGLSAVDVDVVEAHGTGTKLGDPIEAQALLATYGQDRPEDNPLWLGSIKSNIGHTAAAAGVAGVIKTVLALRHGVMPATLNVKQPTDQVDWSQGAVELLTESRDWPQSERPRRAGVSSFGISGTNAHVILEQAPEEESAETGTDHVVPGGATPWLVAGRTEAALRAQAARLAAHLAEHPALSAADVGLSLAGTRSAFEHRAVVLGGDRDALVAGLRSVAEGEDGAGVVSGRAFGSGVVFVFPGQGSQWVGMGRELWDASAVFAESMVACERALSPLVDWSLRDVVFREADDPLWARVDVVQPVLWAVMVSLAAVWRSFGVEPAAVIGHSQGEVAAACVAGGLSLEDGARVAAVRSRLVLEKLSGKGGMVSVSLPVTDVEERIASFEGRIGVAAVNGPASVVVSGEPDALDELLASCEAEGVRARRIAVDYASHSAQVDVLNEDLLRELADIRPTSSSVAFYSTVSGERMDTAGLDAGYWVRNLRERVQFEPVMRLLVGQEYGLFVESSPHPVLTMAMQETQESVVGSGAAVGSLRRGEGGAGRFLTSLAEAYVAGASVDWRQVFAGSGARRVDLPTYAFQHDRYWLKDAVAPGTGVAVDPVDAAFWGAVERADAVGIAELVAGPDANTWEPVLSALAAWRRGRQDRSTLDSWRYRTVWRSVTVGASGGLAGTWLVVSPGGGAPVAEVRGALVAAGAEVVVVDVAPGAGREVFAERLTSVADVAGVAGVVSLLGWDEESAVASTVSLVQAHGEVAPEVPLWVLTRGAAGVGSEDAVRPVQTQVWALGQVVGLERPGGWGGLIDVPVVWDERVAGQFAAVLAAGEGEDQVAVRSSGVFGRRLVRAPFTGSSGVGEWRPRGTVLVTGGTGGVAGHVARWLAGSGAERVVLVSRSGEGAEGASGLVEELRGLGAEVSVVACDVTDRDAVAAVIDAIPADQPLTGVVHAAGVPSFGAVEDVDVADLDRQMSAKTVGARHLDELTAGLDLDAFVLFSSGAAIWGSAGNGVYAAANAFLDGLAWERRGRGLVATSLSWGNWKATGMAEGVAAEQLARLGVRGMDPQLAVQALCQAVGQDETALTVTDMDWERFAPGYTLARRRPLVEDIPDVVRALEADSADTPADDTTGSELRATLAGLNQAEQHAMLVDLVRDEVSGVLGHASSTEISATKPFKDLGFDSLTAMELRNRLTKATGLRLPATLVFDHPTPQQLAALLRTDLVGSEQLVASVASAAGSVVDEPLAVIGMSCKYPGGVGSPEDLWQMVLDNRSGLSDMPTDRGWENWGATGGGRAGFLHEAGDFDAAFFGISPREAMAMDPQQRLLLETSWEVIERSGIDPHSLKGSSTGVFVGGTAVEYGALLMNSSGSQGYAITGASGSVMSGRVAYALGLEGPAVTVDTACSSSLVAIHLAAQSLRTGECDLALAGGVTVLATPGAFAEFDALGGMASDGRCKAFSSDADGIGWGEGVGMLALERLSDARRNGHEVLAVIRGSATNQDGASNGLSAPNGPSQQRVIRQALANAGLSAVDVDVVEAHGTGTKLGDPIEAQALLATYGQDRPEDNPLWLGSIKSNIGHTAAASGVAGMIKSVLALRNGVMPATLHVKEPTHQVDWSLGAVELLTENREWPEFGRPRRAGVSSFGISGTNAHIILEEVTGEEEATSTASEPQLPAVPALITTSVPWVISGRSAGALRGQAVRLRDLTLREPHLGAGDVALSLATTRAMLDHRAVVMGGSGAELAERLDAVATGRSGTGVVSGDGVSQSRVVFVFPGQGSQWVGMGRELWDSSAVFAESMVACERALSPLVDWSLRDVVFREADDPLWARVDVVQPVLWAVMVSLAAVWRSFGVEPAAVIGHSQGEVAAACVAGGLSLEDGARVAAVRSRLVLEKLSGKGGMVSVSLPVTDVEERIASYDGRIGVAAVNGPASVVVSGEPDALDELLASCEAEGVRARRIAVDYASHSAQVDVLNEDLLRELADIRPQSSSVAFYSTVSGERMDTAGLDAGYWVRNLRERVQFEPVSRLLAEKGAFFIESSPHPVLTMALIETGENAAAPVTAVGSLRRGEGGADRFLTSLAEAYVAGASVDWRQVFAGSGARRVDLPTYAFQRDRYWLKDAVAPAAGGVGGAVDPVDAAFWDAVEREDLEGLAGVLDVTGTEAGDVVAGVQPLLPMLAAWRRGRQDRSTLDSWRYRTVWRSVTVGASGGLAGTWLVVSPGGGAPVAEVRGALVAAGAEVVVVDVAPGAGREVFAERLTSVADVADVAGVAGVVSLLGWDEESAVASTVSLVQAHGEVAPEVPLWVLTRGVAAVGSGDVVRPVQTQVWALGQVVGLERPGGWGGLIDVPVVWDERVAGQFAAVLAAGEGEDQVAVRSSGVFGRRLVRAPFMGSSGVGEWRPRGTVLVTGGTGGVAGHVARWLAGSGAERVVLVSRSGEGAEGASGLVEELRGLGAEVSVVACDVTDRDAVAAVIDAIPADQPLTGVVHAAGVPSFGAVEDVDVADLDRQMSAKTVGARHLDELTAGLDLDAFVLFSSGAAIWGSAGNGVYAAANAFLDGLAWERRGRGLVATSLSWGNWKATGMAEGVAAEQLARLGVRGMDPQLAVQALCQAVGQDETALTVTDMDWERFAPGYTLARRRPLVEDIPDVVRALEADSADTPADDTTGSELRATLAGLNQAEQHAQLLSLVRTEASQALGYSGIAEITPAKPFKDLGFDSLTAMELRNRLNKATGLRLPATLVFDHPNAQQLAEHLHGQLGKDDKGGLSDVLDIRRELTRIGEALDGVAQDERAREDIADHLRDLLATLGAAERDATTDLDAATDDEIFDYIDRDLGVS